MKTLRIEWTGPFSLNNQRVGAHWRAHTAENTTLHQFANMSASDQGIVFESPVTVEACMTVPKGILPDADSIALAVKYVIDGIVESGAIADDSPQYVRSVTYHAAEKDPDRPRSLIVMVKPCEDRKL